MLNFLRVLSYFTIFKLMAQIIALRITIITSSFSMPRLDNGNQNRIHLCCRQTRQLFSFGLFLPHIGSRFESLEATQFIPTQTSRHAHGRAFSAETCRYGLCSKWDDYFVTSRGPLESGLLALTLSSLILHSAGLQSNGGVFDLLLFSMVSS